jgi:hypothetical protein
MRVALSAALATHPGDADYQGVELGNLWFVSLEYETRTSSLTRHQAYQSEDGLYRFVVSGQDPGRQTWLDSEGHSRGLIMLRWQGLSEAQDASRQPSARVVPIGRVRQDLPPDTPEFGPAKRAQQIRGRRREAQQRFPG